MVRGAGELGWDDICLACCLQLFYCDKCEKAGWMTALTSNWRGDSFQSWHCVDSCHRECLAKYTRLTNENHHTQHPLVQCRNLHMSHSFLSCHCQMLNLIYNAKIVCYCDNELKPLFVTRFCWWETSTASFFQTAQAATRRQQCGGVPLRSRAEPAKMSADSTAKVGNSTSSPNMYMGLWCQNLFSGLA